MARRFGSARFHMPGHNFPKSLHRVNVSCALLIKHHSVEAYGEEDVQLYLFVTFAKVETEWSTSRFGRLNSEERAPEANE
jgi:hypothetical protein